MSLIPGRRHVVIGPIPGEWWVFIALGLCAGVVSGTLGVGSGIIVIPALVLLLGFEQKAAQGTALAVMVPMALVGAIRYWRNPQVELDGLVIILLMVGAVAGTLAGTELAARMSGGGLRKVFAVVLVLVAARMFTASPPRGQTASENGTSNPSTSQMTHPGDKNDPATQQ
jgi:hypothetical protein